MANQESILYTKDADGVATLTLNRPERMNAFNIDMIERWHAALTDAFADTTVKVVVVTGAGRAFCAGGDMDELLRITQMDSLGRKNFLWAGVHKIALALERSDKPVIAAINGTARGAGCDMALMCDLRVMAESATLAESYINMGLIAGDAGTYFLPRLIGTARALELFWTGRVVGAAEAERMGMVNRVVKDTELMTATYALAHEIAAQPQQAVRFFKRMVYQSQTIPLLAHLDMVSSHMAVLQDTADHRAKLDAFRARKGETKK